MIRRTTHAAAALLVGAMWIGCSDDRDCGCGSIPRGALDGDDAGSVLSFDTNSATPGAGADIVSLDSQGTDGQDGASGLDGTDGGSAADGTDGESGLDTSDLADAGGVDGADNSEDARGEADTAAELCGNGELDPDEACDGPTPCSEVVGPGWLGEVPCNETCTALGPTSCTQIGSIVTPAVSCAELASTGLTESGTYYLESLGDEPIEAWCDLPSGWTLVVSRDWSPIEGPWGTFFEGTAGPSTEFQAIPFLDLTFTPSEVRLEAVGEGLFVGRSAAPGATWEQLENGVRLPLAEGGFLVFSDQPSTGAETFCFVSGLFDTGFKCDGSGGQIEEAVGFMDSFTEDEFCNCSTYGWKQEPSGCEATLCEPTGLFAAWIR